VAKYINITVATKTQLEELRKGKPQARNLNQTEINHIWGFNISECTSVSIDSFKTLSRLHFNCVWISALTLVHWNLFAARLFLITIANSVQNVCIWLNLNTRKWYRSTETPLAWQLIASGGKSGDNGLHVSQFSFNVLLPAPFCITSSAPSLSHAHSAALTNRLIHDTRFSHPPHNLMLSTLPRLPVYSAAPVPSSTRPPGWIQARHVILCGPAAA